MLPLGRARRLAYEKTRGKYIAILDADDIWLPQKLERQLPLFHADPQVAMTYCDTMCFDQGGDRYRVSLAAKPHRGLVFGNLLEGNFIGTTAVMFRRAALERLGCVFDDKYARAPDFDLMLRVAYHHRTDYLDEPLCRWRMSDVDEKAWKQSQVPRVVEIKEVIDSLVETYPDIQTRYGTELGLLRTRLDYNFGITAWRNGEVTEARNHLFRHIAGKKFAFVFLCTFLMSYDAFNKLKTLFRNQIARRNWGRMRP